MFKGFVLGVLATLVAAVVCAFVVVRMGLIPASADSGPLPLEQWAANTSLEATLARKAPKASNPVPLTDANLVAGVKLFGEHCAICHGTAQGDASATPIALGEYPSPPQLAEEGVEDDPMGWDFWKIKHGIRWTGMPAWGNTLSDRQIWTLALFLKHMDRLPPPARAAWHQVTNTEQKADDQK